jgi:putative AlgH/UPF0301 family transcriptional regulator
MHAVMQGTSLFYSSSKSSSGDHEVQRLDPIKKDWREFRAKLVLQEYGHVVATDDQYQQWAYQQDLLEAGALLVHKGFDISKPYLTKAVMMVVETNDKETVALILNRPSNCTLYEKDFSAILLYGGPNGSFHLGQEQRVFCIHRQPNCLDVSQEVLSGLFLTSLDDAKHLQEHGRAVPADFLYISGYETLSTEEIRTGIKAGTWTSITADALTLQQNLLPDLWSSILTLTGYPPSPPTEESVVHDKLLHEWTQKALLFDKPCEPIASSPHIIQEGDLLRSSSLPHAFLFDHQAFHRSLLLVLEANDQEAVGALLTAPTMEVEPLTGLPIRHGGSTVDDVYCLHYLGDAVGGRKIGKSFYLCSVQEAKSALDRDIARPDELLIVKGMTIFPKVNAALDWVSPDAAPDVWSLLSQQSLLGPFTLESNIDTACQAWRVAGGNDCIDSELFHLGYEAVKLWLSTNLLQNNGLKP